MSRDSLARRRKVLGDDHPETLTSLNDLAELLELHDFKAADPLFRETYATRRRVLGDHHPSTLLSQNNLASCLRLQGCFKESKHIYRSALEGHMKYLGIENSPEFPS